MAIQQFAIIWNYNAYVEHQHFHYGASPGKETGEDDSDAEAIEVPNKVEEQEELSCELVEKLKPIFYNNEGDVKAFLKEIVGMKPKDITDLVNKWVEEKRISGYGNSRKGDLWKILHEAKLYSRTIQNWNRRVY